jgi:predicted O-methyltransferase YrrM
MNFNYNSLDEFYNKNKILVTEGYCKNILNQYDELIKICNKVNPVNILEIGFNGGHSSELFLKNSKAYIYSFDIGEHFNEYLKYGKIFLNHKYPNRHTLVFGNSNQTIPKFANNNPNIKFDIIFIDGGHDYDVALSDILNCSVLSHPNSVLIVDDTIKYNNDWHASYTIGPTKAWNECLNKKIIIEDNSYDWAPGRGMSVGKYLFN